jgi:hypothetical protein
MVRPKNDSTKANNDEITPRWFDFPLSYTATAIICRPSRQQSGPPLAEMTRSSAVFSESRAFGRRCRRHERDVRFGSKVDILGRLLDVRFTPESRRRSANWVRFVMRTWRSLLLAGQSNLDQAADCLRA